MEIRNLTEDSVRAEVERRIPGSYSLGRFKKGRPLVLYVGRSDLDLRRRLLQHARTRRFQWYTFEPTLTIFEAFRLECRGWHYYSSIINTIHPDAPAGLPYLCPYCLAGRELTEGLRGTTSELKKTL